MFQLWCMPITVPETLPQVIALIIYCLEGSLDSPLMLNLALKGGTTEPPSKSTYATQLRRRLRFAHKKAKQVADKQQARHKELYDRRCRGAALDIGDLVLVKKTAWKGKHKIQDRWESDEYQVIEQPIPWYSCLQGKMYCRR